MIDVRLRTDLIRFALDMRDLTSKDLAIGCGITEAAVSQYRNDKRLPSVPTLYKLSSFLGITMDKLIVEKLSLPAPVNAKNGAAFSVSNTTHA